MLKLQAACHMHGPANGALKREAAYTAALASCVQATVALQSGQRSVQPRPSTHVLGSFLRHAPDQTSSGTVEACCMEDPQVHHCLLYGRPQVHHCLMHERSPGTVEA